MGAVSSGIALLSAYLPSDASYRERALSAFTLAIETAAIILLLVLVSIWLAFPQRSDLLIVIPATVCVGAVCHFRRTLPVDFRSFS